MKGQSNRPDVKQPSDRFELQGSNNFWLLPARRGSYSKKMIKEDHYLACTTKMLEILVALPHQIRQTRSSRVTTWIARTAQVHLSFRTHILAAIRLFTCQRARLIRTPISHPNFGQSSATGFYCKRRWQLSLPSSRVPDWGGGY